jgi:HSP20 family molecular chaperone IbpA
MTANATATQMAPVPTKAMEQGDVFDRFDQICTSIAKHAFEIFESNGRHFGHEFDDWFKAESELLHPVHVRIAESDDALTVEAEVPGFEAKDLQINVEPRRLTISGKKETKEEQKKGKAVYQEQCSNEILRVIDLPAEVLASKAAATLKNGMLELQMPKSPKTKGTHVEVKPA